MEGVRDGWRLVARKGQKNRETKRQEEEKRETLEKKVMGCLFWNEGEEVLDFKQLIRSSTYLESSLKGLNHQLKFAEEQKPQSLFKNYQMSHVLNRACELLQMSFRAAVVSWRAVAFTNPRKPFQYIREADRNVIGPHLFVTIPVVIYCCPPCSSHSWQLLPGIRECGGSERRTTKGGCQQGKEDSSRVW